MPKLVVKKSCPAGFASLSSCLHAQDSTKIVYTEEADRLVKQCFIVGVGFAF